MDQPAVTDTCNPSSGQISTDPPCYDPLNSYVDTAFTRVYAVLFAALAVQVLALSNAITALCTRTIYGDDDEDERRRRRKSGIRLDDMSISPDTPTTAGSHNHFGMSAEDAKSYYGGGYKEGAYSSRSSPYNGHGMYNYNNNSYSNQNGAYNHDRYY